MGTRPFGFGEVNVTAFGRHAYESATTSAPIAEGFPPRSREAGDSKKVFVVHGRDESAREKVARFLEKLGLEPIILSEQANEGRTLIEKFETNALDVVYAVVILTPDDYGRGPDEEQFPEHPNRARQNVVLELGYFMAALGRSRVTPLVQEGTEHPSDIHGLVYVPLDRDGAWRLLLGRELRAAGLDVDMNDAV